MSDGLTLFARFIMIDIIIMGIIDKFINPIIAIIIGITSPIIFYYYGAYKYNDYNWMFDIVPHHCPVRKEEEGDVELD